MELAILLQLQSLCQVHCPWSAMLRWYYRAPIRFHFQAQKRGLTVWAEVLIASAWSGRLCSPLWCDWLPSNSPVDTRNQVYCGVNHVAFYSGTESCAQSFENLGFLCGGQKDDWSLLSLGRDIVPAALGCGSKCPTVLRVPGIHDCRPKGSGYKLGAWLLSPLLQAISPLDIVWELESRACAHSSEGLIVQNWRGAW